MICLLALALLLGGCGGSRPSPLVEKGCLDLSGWNFDRTGPVEVTGEWSFYWETLVFRDSFSRATAFPQSNYAVLPGLWRNMRNNGAALPSRGYATYGLKISGLSPGPYTLYISDTLSVAEVWVNGRLAASGGQVSKTGQGEIPDKHALFARFEAMGPVTEIWVQVSNFTNMEGGINSPVWLGPDRRITNVADAVDPNDAVNLSQMNQAVNRLDKNIGDVGALASAFSALVPLSQNAGSTQLSLGFGSYESSQAVAMGVFHYLNDRVVVNAGVSTAFDREKTAARAGITIGW